MLSKHLMHFLSVYCVRIILFGTALVHQVCTKPITFHGLSSFFIRAIFADCKAFDVQNKETFSNDVSATILIDHVAASRSPCSAIRAFTCEKSVTRFDIASSPCIALPSNSRHQFCSIRRSSNLTEHVG